MSDQRYAVEMRSISKSFPGVKALDDVSLQVRPGSVHALMGENGAGKSTLMKCLFGIYKPDSGSILIIISQTRDNIGFGFETKTRSGGHALKFYATIRLEVRRVETISQGTDEAIGNKVRVKVVKNKVSPPYRKAEMEMMFGSGLSASGGLLDAALQNKIVEKSGSWYSYGTERIGQGRENAKSFLEQHPEIYGQIDAKVRQILFPPKGASPAAAPAQTPSTEPVTEPAEERPKAAREKPAASRKPQPLARPEATENRWEMTS